MTIAGKDLLGLGWVSITILAFATLHWGRVAAAQPPANAGIDSGTFEASADEVPAVEGAYSLAPCPGQQAPGGTIVVCWTAPACAAASNDWISLYAAGATNQQWGPYFYTQGQPNGCRGITVPTTADGTYEFRYILAGSSPYRDVARSSQITICATCTAPLAGCPCAKTDDCNDRDRCTNDACLDGICHNVDPGSSNFTLGACPDSVAPGGTLLICWTAPVCRASSGDWISLYAAGATNQHYGPWFYTSAQGSGCRTIIAPAALGTYEFRYILAGTSPYRDVARSSPISICTGCSAGPTGCCQLTPACSTNADCGLFCNRAETCQHGCCVTPTLPSGVSCVSDGECTDNNRCTLDRCVNGCCTHTPGCSTNAECDDGMFCNGAEKCQSGCCLAGTPSCCASNQCCNEDANACQAGLGCTSDAGCNDDNPCTDDRCVSGCCTHTNNTALCDDGIFCNGRDTCSDGVCSVHAGNPCPPPATCNEANHRCEGGCVGGPFTIGGAIYSNCASPLTTGVADVDVCVTCDGGFHACAATAGGAGLWHIDNVPCGGHCTVTPTKAGWKFCHVTGACPPEPNPCVPTAPIDVFPQNQSQNQSIQFFGKEIPCLLSDMNCDGFCSIPGDALLFVDCVYRNSCACPCPGPAPCVPRGDCNCDGFLSIVGDVPCFLDRVYFGHCSTVECPCHTTAGASDESGSTIGGAVYQDENDPLFSGLEGVEISVESDDGMVVASTTSGRSGLWRIDGLAEGEYTVLFRSQDRDGSERVDARSIVVRAEDKAANQSIVLERPVEQTKTMKPHRAVRPERGR